MGDFTEVINGLPILGAVAKRESYQDKQGVEIIVITPLDGSPAEYQSALNMQTTQGPMRVTFGIKAGSVEDACTGWRQAAQEALREFGEQMKANQRRIVLPGNPAANGVPFKQMN